MIDNNSLINSNLTSCTPDITVLNKVFIAEKKTKKKKKKNAKTVQTTAILKKFVINLLICKDDIGKNQDDKSCFHIKK